MIKKLKIISNVYLTELEKFGFRYSFKDDHFNGFMYIPKKNTDVPLVIIDIQTRIISIQGICDKFNTIENTLYDLFEAGLIERIQQE